MINKKDTLNSINDKKRSIKKYAWAALILKKFQQKIYTLACINIKKIYTLTCINIKNGK